MFESSARLEEEARGLLEAVRVAADGFYACLLDRSGIVFESTPDDGGGALGERLRSRAAAVLGLPAALEAEGPGEDLFAGFEGEAFLVAVLNGHAALVVACPDGEAARAAVERPLHALVDRLLRLRPAWRVDASGRGLFFGRPRLDVVVVEKEPDRLE